MVLCIRATCLIVLLGLSPAPRSHAAVVSFLVDPTTIDNNPTDGFITGTEFSPTGSDGTVFTMTPTSNLVGPPRFLLSPTDGLSFGGGSGSTLTFDFVPSVDIQLESYTIGGGLSVNDPMFDIREGAVILSSGNSGDASGAFSNGPVLLQGGTTYSFIVTNGSALHQRQMATWNYSATAIPEPSSFAALCISGTAALIHRRRNKNAAKR